ncbi:MAG: Photosystem I assembly protein Ycf3 [Candidatus Dichloromethanomonas elyunquensis]|nr:MAG: Photosystem I assembly protein Ycf3 [Candidatus Dichloromethanomonas elyunquensis]
MKAFFNKKISLLLFIALLGITIFSADLLISAQDSSPSSSVEAQTSQPRKDSSVPAVQPNSPPVQKESSQALTYYEQGLKLYYQRNFSQALSLFDKALILDPNCYQALNGKGAAYAFQGRYSEGLNLIREALRIKPDFEYGCFNLGLANELAGNWTAAVSAYQTALSYDSRDAWAYYGIASIYGRQGNADQTVFYLKQAIAIEPDAKETAKTEHDFDPVRSSSKFQALFNN